MLFRGATAYALPPEGLSLCGVGYDPYDLSYFKFMSKLKYNKMKMQDEHEFQRYNKYNNYTLPIDQSLFQRDFSRALKNKKKSNFNKPSIS